MLVLAGAAVSAKRPVIAGVLTGLALTKPTMAVPFVLLLLVWREWRAIATAASIQAALVAGVSAWLRISPVTLTREWFEDTHGQLASGTIDVPTLVQGVWGRFRGPRRWR